MKINKKKKGMTLVEVVISLCILVMIIPLVLSISIYCTKSNMKAKEKQQADIIAQREIETITCKLKFNCKLDKFNGYKRDNKSNCFYKVVNENYKPKYIVTMSVIKKVEYNKIDIEIYEIIVNVYKYSGVYESRKYSLDNKDILLQSIKTTKTLFK
ncbi:hypothetical protein Z957_11490 [Clostridium sp. K25]|uniref:type IV pilus modification PilV family protein n=1 Tax=Clostridium sp. K25 TaxID=1443109 RepID=UPI0004D5C93E|nr:type II secretion system protein [Clostridium sp. K25]KEI06489.1 hypothetical protein Z957_11490 [Clostridium sp. K25]